MTYARSRKSTLYRRAAVALCIGTGVAGVVGVTATLVYAAAVALDTPERQQERACRSVDGASPIINQGFVCPEPK